MITHAQLARVTARIARNAATTTAALTDGMWNPNFCAANADQEAKVFIQDLRDVLNRLEEQVRDTAL
jgi:hypothetical protein